MLELPCLQYLLPVVRSVFAHCVHTGCTGLITSYKTGAVYSSTGLYIISTMAGVEVSWLNVHNTSSPGQIVGRCGEEYTDVNKV